MSTKSLRDAIKEAKQASPVNANYWDDEARVLVEVVNANAKLDSGYTPQVGLQLERKDTGKRLWFTLWFNQGDTSEDMKRLASTGRTLSSMGCDALMDSIDAAYGDDLSATLNALAAGVKGVKFYADFRKAEKKKTKDQLDMNDEDREYNTYFDAKELVEGPAPVSFASASGFGQGAAVPTATPTSAPAADAHLEIPTQGTLPAFGAGFNPMGS